MPGFVMDFCSLGNGILYYSSTNDLCLLNESFFQFYVPRSKCIVILKNVSQCWLSLLFLFFIPYPWRLGFASCDVHLCTLCDLWIRLALAHSIYNVLMFDKKNEDVSWINQNYFDHCVFFKTPVCKIVWYLKSKIIVIKCMYF